MSRIVIHAQDAGFRANGFIRPICEAKGSSNGNGNLSICESEVTCYQCRRLARSKYAYWDPRNGVRVDRWSIHRDASKKRRRANG